MHKSFPSRPVPSRPVPSRPVLPALPCPALPCPALPCPALPTHPLWSLSNAAKYALISASSETRCARDSIRATNSLKSISPFPATTSDEQARQYSLSTPSVLREGQFSAQSSSVSAAGSQHVSYISSHRYSPVGFMTPQCEKQTRSSHCDANVHKIFCTQRTKNPSANLYFCAPVLVSEKQTTYFSHFLCGFLDPVEDGAPRRL